MSWVITGTQKILPAAAEYVDRIQKADGQALEQAVYEAILEFAEWRIPYGGACALLSGPRTLAGALVPMVGPALTPRNIVTGDYNRQRVLLDGSTKDFVYPFDNANALSGTQDNRHAVAGLFANFLPTGQQYLFGSGADGAAAGIGRDGYRSNGVATGLVTSSSSVLTINTFSTAGTLLAGFHGNFRESSSSYVVAEQGANLRTVNVSSSPPDGFNWTFGSRGQSFYAPIALTIASVGQHIDPAEYRTKYAKLMTDLAAAGV